MTASPPRLPARLAGPLALAVVLALPYAGGCQLEAVEPPGPGDAPSVRSAALEGAPPTEALIAAQLDRERAIKAAAAGPLAVRRPIDWRGAQEAPTTRHALADETRRRLEGVELPVLLPADLELLGVAIASSGDGWYALSMTLDGHNVYLHGSRHALRLPVPLEQAHGAPQPSAPRVTHNEAIAALTFDAWGASYALTVECDDPEGDPRCTGTDYVVDLAASLGRFVPARAVDPAPAEEEARR